LREGVGAIEAVKCGSKCNITMKKGGVRWAYMKEIMLVGLPVGPDSDRSKAQKE
jgi:hypothetical protein